MVLCFKCIIMARAHKAGLANVVTQWQMVFRVDGYMALCFRYIHMDDVSLVNAARMMWQMVFTVRSHMALCFRHIHMACGYEASLVYLNMIFRVKGGMVLCFRCIHMACGREACLEYVVIRMACTIKGCMVLSIHITSRHEAGFVDVTMVVWQMVFRVKRCMVMQTRSMACILKDAVDPTWDATSMYP